MGYVLPSYEELPLPTSKKVQKNPDFYWGKLKEYQEMTYFFRHFGLEWLFRLLKRRIT